MDAPPKCWRSIYLEQTPGGREMNNTMSDAIALIGRLLLAAMFVYAGYGKIGGFEGTAGYIASKGLPLAQLLAAGTIALEIVAGLMLVVGWKARWAAFALAAFTVLASVIFHAYWAFPVDQFRTQQLFFLKNMATTGGLLMIVAFGAGRWSLDRR
jgi:putative oxidoreductase